MFVFRFMGLLFSFIGSLFLFMVMWIIDKIEGDPIKRTIKRLDKEIEATQYLFDKEWDSKRAMELHLELEKLKKHRERVSKCEN